jgi:hypothetical protein
MSILAQCGFGRGNKIERGLESAVIEGVIMSPRDERRDRLEQTVTLWNRDYPHSIIFFDPQFYAAALNVPRDGHLSEYDYYNNNNGLGRTHFSGTRIHRYVQECLDYQHKSFQDRVRFLISPTVLFDGFRDFWSQVALNMAVESADYHAIMPDDPAPLLLSIVVSETAFQTMDAMEEFLDALTELDVEGFYLIIRRNANSIQNAMEAASFGRLLYFCYILSELNEYKVIAGYSDWHSFLLKVVGVAHTACGWYQNLRQFSLARWQPPTGGRRPLKRYSSLPLLSCPLIIPEVQDIYLANLLPRVLTGTDYDSILSSGPSKGETSWSDEVSCLAHWFSLDAVSQQISKQPNISARIQEAERIMQNAHTLYRHLENNGISFDPQTGPDHIAEWRTSLQEFCGIAGIQRTAGGQSN